MAEPQPPEPQPTDLFGRWLAHRDHQADPDAAASSAASETPAEPQPAPGASSRRRLPTAAVASSAVERDPLIGSRIVPPSNFGTRRSPAADRGQEEDGQAGGWEPIVMRSARKKAEQVEAKQTPKNERPGRLQRLKARLVDPVEPAPEAEPEDELLAPPAPGPASPAAPPVGSAPAPAPAAKAPAPPAPAAQAPAAQAPMSSARRLARRRTADAPAATTPAGPAEPPPPLPVRSPAPPSPATRPIEETIRTAAAAAAPPAGRRVAPPRPPEEPLGSEDMRAPAPVRAFIEPVPAPPGTAPEQGVGPDSARAEAARAARAELARAEAEARAEEARAEQARAEAEAAEAARAEQARLEALRAEQARAQAEAARAEQARLEAVRAEQARAEEEAARAEQARADAEAVRAEQARAQAQAEAARAEQARLEAVRAEQARADAEAARAEQARAQAAQAEAARAEQARAAQSRAEPAPTPEPVSDQAVGSSDEQPQEAPHRGRPLRPLARRSARRDKGSRGEPARVEPKDRTGARPPLGGTSDAARELVAAKARARAAAPVRPTADPGTDEAAAEIPAAAARLASKLAKVTRHDEVAAEMPGIYTFKPKRAVRRLLTVSLLAGLVVSAYFVSVAVEVKDSWAIGLAAIVVLATVMIWAIRGGASVTKLTVHQGQLEVVQQGARMVFDMASQYTLVEVHGQPGERGWHVVFPRRGMPPFKVDASIVDPDDFMRVLRFFRPQLRQ